MPPLFQDLGDFMAKISKSLAKRLTFSAVILSIVGYVIFFAPFLVYILGNSLIIGLALYEFYTVVEAKGLKTNKYIGVAFGLIFPFFMYFPGEVIAFAASILLILFFNHNNRDDDDKYGGLINTAITLFGLIYVALLSSYFVKLKFLPHGSIWVAYLITVIKIGDAGAYFYGSAAGKTHLYPNISPKKTLEGAIAGVIVSILCSVLFKLFIPEVSLLSFIVMGFLLSIIGQAGDLVESLIKRECGVKDSGVVPGLGGFLDIMDSLFFSAPFLYYYLTVKGF